MPVVIKHDTDHMHVAQSPAGKYCDFCNAPNPTVTYDAPDFTMAQLTNSEGKTLTHNSVGAWAACSDCEKLIDAGDWEGMVKRALDAEVVQGTIEERHREGLGNVLRECYFRLQSVGISKRK